MARSWLRGSLRGLWFALLWLKYLTLLPQPLDGGGKLLGERFLGRHGVSRLEAAPDLGGKLSIREGAIKRAVRA
ncbi:hypothetical protein [Microvirga arabica]|uniref:hypothetical protein n=1 Tax=Microvirga arabica TaxID=1128671 RepID=UPI0019399CE0|nr:hypothetical protein [Microvirga arabica]MBM1173429.1 hypothetical protein [Microvirga arabica]